MKASRALVCEFLGTAFLLASVVGSGALAHRLDMGNVALSVLCVSFATMGTLSACIFAFGAISAHFNPVVTLALAIRKEFTWKDVLPYWLAQTAGAIVGVAITNLMFELPPICISDTMRSGYGQWLGEFVATFGLLGIIFGCAKANTKAIPIAVPFYVAGAIFFTSSTCFANPAVTIARMITTTLCGIAPGCVAPFIGFQMLGCFAALTVFGWLFSKEDIAVPEFAGSKIAGSEIAGSERPGSERPGSERAGAEISGSDIAVPDHAPTAEALKELAANHIS